MFTLNLEEDCENDFRCDQVSGLVLVLSLSPSHSACSILGADTQQQAQGLKNINNNNNPTTKNADTEDALS